MINENLITNILVVFFGIFSGPVILQLLQFYKNRKIERILNSKDIIKIFQDDKSFYKKFISSVLKEKYFEYMTGIKTNINTISKYINFKNKLKNDYTWEDIKIARKYLKTDKKKIYIKITKRQLFLADIGIISMPLLFLPVFILLFYIPEYPEISEWKIQILLFLIFCVLSFVLFKIFNYAYPVFIAKNMKKRLIK